MKKFFLLFLSLTLLTPSLSFADEMSYDGPPSWQNFDDFMKQREQEDEITGLSYLISGAIATVGGSVGYYGSSDTFSRGAYAITQSVGVAALGYGATIYFNGNEYDSFYRAVRDSSLSSAQKNEVLQRFLANEKEQHDRARWIRVATHTLLAALNFYSAAHEKDKDVRNIFQFLGGVNAVIAVSYAF